MMESKLFKSSLLIISSRLKQVLKNRTRPVLDYQKSARRKKKNLPLPNLTSLNTLMETWLNSWKRRVKRLYKKIKLSSCMPLREPCL